MSNNTTKPGPTSSTKPRVQEGSSVWRRMRIIREVRAVNTRTLPTTGVHRRVSRIVIILRHNCPNHPITHKPPHHHSIRWVPWCDRKTRSIGSPSYAKTIIPHVVTQMVTYITNVCMSAWTDSNSNRKPMYYSGYFRPGSKPCGGIIVSPIVIVTKFEPGEWFIWSNRYPQRTCILTHPCHSMYYI